MALIIFIIIEVIVMFLTFNYKKCIFFLESDKSQNYIFKDIIKIYNK